MDETKTICKTWISIITIICLTITTISISYYRHIEKMMDKGAAAKDYTIKK
jgi:hypothetical protein